MPCNPVTLCRNLRALKVFGPICSKVYASVMYAFLIYIESITFSYYSLYNICYLLRIYYEYPKACVASHSAAEPDIS